MSYTEHNRQTIDGWVAEGWEWSIPLSHEEYVSALNGDYRLLLTPTKTVPPHWLGDLKGKRVLALASGGGQQGPILIAQGAIVTVFDLSPAQLAREQEVASREGYFIELIQGDMTQPLPFPDNHFDIIIHPVSNCYIEQVEPVWRECARILTPGGYLLAGLDNGMNFVVDEDEERLAYALPHNPLKDEAQRQRALKDGAGYQFSHSIEEQITGQLRAGLELLDLYEDTNGIGRLHELKIPTFWATLSRKP